MPSELELELASRIMRLEKQLADLQSRDRIGEWDLIDREALTGTQASVTFSSIPQNYTSLVLVSEARTGRATRSDNVALRFNGISAAQYDWIQMFAQGAVGVSQGVQRGATSILGPMCDGANATASSYAPSTIWIIGYANTSSLKYALTNTSVQFEDRGADNRLWISVRGGSWDGLGAVTSVSIIPFVGPNFLANSKFSLYGVL
jgi:hypothetical protein